ncbi:hypothetical protein BZG35_15855 [Brevundimonas sp. LM2]|uniref:hypothetical protein n=1 Tax=Brevundimonas sp. LM2 TaxID=1938605 RepID=UPI000983E186|nr:hypothetical protein [Brevundimonas sp. LM2]AQR62966.1 hypothetical protein BZG35_15855 [Brevundimonas sp. LM2]
MKRLAPLPALALMAVAGTVSAQVRPVIPYVGATVADQHRYENERLYQRSRDQAATARQNQLGARLTRQDLQAARAPEPYIPLQPLIPQTPEAARRDRDTAVAGVTQIDDWLDRRPR